MANSDITASRLRDILEYNPDTGFFAWKVRFGKRGVVGRRAGTVDVAGYEVVTINKKRHKSHRLAWLYMTGNWPAVAVDHRNGIRTDNRFCNLREAGWDDNQQNRGHQSNNKSGYIGVSWDEHAGKWRAGIRYAGKGYNLGNFTDPEMAHKAYLEKKAELHKFNPVPRDA
jgi:hypothetical protein